MRIITFDCALINLGITCIDYHPERIDTVKREFAKLVDVAADMAAAALRLSEVSKAGGAGEAGELAVSSEEVEAGGELPELAELMQARSVMLAARSVAIDELSAAMTKVYEQQLRCHEATLSVVELVFFNVVNMIPNRKMKSMSKMEQTIVTKQVLTGLDGLLGRPDIVLIEFQMFNPTMSCVSHQIAYHYTDCSVLPILPSVRHADNCNGRCRAARGKRRSKCAGAPAAGSPVAPVSPAAGSPVAPVSPATPASRTPIRFNTSIHKDRKRQQVLVQPSKCIVYFAHTYPLQQVARCTRPPIRVEFIGTGYKNDISIGEGGHFHNFAAEPEANKKHADWNCREWIRLMGTPEQAEEFARIRNKTLDIADSLLGAFGWIAAGMPQCPSKSKLVGLNHSQSTRGIACTY